MTLAEALGDLLSRLDSSAYVMLSCYLVVGAVLLADVATGEHELTAAALARGASLTATGLLAMVCAVPFAAVLGIVWTAYSALVPDLVARWWAGHAVAAFLVCFMVTDLVAYLYHRAGHRWRVGWSSHQVHHVGRRYDMTLVLRQPWLPVHGLVIVPLTALAGFSIEMAAVCSGLSLAYQAVQHTRHPWNLGRMEGILGSAQAHRHHHLLEGGGTNLGAVFVVWDRVFDTWQPGLSAPGELGIGASESMNPLRLQLAGWRPRPFAVPEDDLGRRASSRH